MPGVTGVRCFEELKRIFELLDQQHPIEAKRHLDEILNELDDRTRWYPTARLFRQERPDWAPVMDRVAAALNALTTGCAGKEAVA